MTIGTFLRKKRQQKGVSMYRLAQISGVSDAQINLLEHGKVQNPGFRILCLLSDALGFSLDELKEIVLKEVTP